MNETLAIEWLNKAYHHLSSAKVLLEAKHFTDVIAIDLHYGIEVTLKSILAYQNQKIIKTHDLVKLTSIINDKIEFNQNELDLLDIVTTYHIRGSYPPKDRRMPSFDEIEKVYDFGISLLTQVCKILNIDEQKIKY